MANTNPKRQRGRAFLTRRNWASFQGASSLTLRVSESRVGIAHHSVVGDGGQCPPYKIYSRGA